MKGGFYAFGGLEDDVGGGNEPSMFGPGGAYYCSKCGPHYVASYINYPFELLGNLTGGLNFEAANHFVMPPHADIQGFVLALPPARFHDRRGSRRRS